MRLIESLSRTRWKCKYHVVFIPKYRKKAIFGQIRKELGDVFRRLARQNESVIEEGPLMSDHVHMMISIPPKYAVSQVIGFIKGKGAFCNFFGQLLEQPCGWRIAKSRGNRSYSAVVVRDFCGTRSCVVVLHPACVTTGVPASS